MIKALILVHLWSIIVAGGACVFQRDGDGQVGARFPAPNIWLTLIALCFLPGILYFIPFGAAISLPDVDIFELIPAQVSESRAGGSGSLNYLAVYFVLSLLLIIRTLWRWARLQTLPLKPTPESDVFTTAAEIPPLTLSWPRRAIVIPDSFHVQSALIRHERAHLRHQDAELTLLLLLLQDVMLRSPGISYLVRQWRLSIELRADHAATEKLTAPQRKEYASLLLSLQRPNGDDSGTLPCPTARLDTARHRNAKMRLIEIMKNEPHAKKHRWVAALLFTSIAASAIGLMGSVATAKDEVINAKSGEVDYVQVDYVKQTSLQMPANCPGLIGDLKSRGVKFEKKEIAVNGQLVLQHTMKLGTVILSHDVRKDGSIYNSNILRSTHQCFEANAKAAIVHWKADSQASDIKNAAVKLPFIISGETPEELKLQLNRVSQ